MLGNASSEQWVVCRQTDAVAMGRVKFEDPAGGC